MTKNMEEITSMEEIVQFLKWTSWKMDIGEGVRLNTGKCKMRLKMKIQDGQVGRPSWSKSKRSMHANELEDPRRVSSCPPRNVQYTNGIGLSTNFCRLPSTAIMTVDLDSNQPSKCFAFIIPSISPILLLLFFKSLQPAN